MRPTGWMIVRYFVPLALIASLHVSAVPVRAASQATSEAEQAGRVKASITSHGVRPKATVTVKMRDGAKMKGYISEVGDESFSLTDAKTLRATTISYTDVATVDRGLPKVVKTAIWAGTAIGIVAVIDSIGLLPCLGR